MKKMTVGQPKLETRPDSGHGGGYVCCIYGDARSKSGCYLGV